MAITSSGIGSGIDIEGLVTQLVQAQSQPTENRIALEERLLQTELSAYGTLKGSLSGLQIAVADIKNASSFQKRSVQLSSETEMTALATNDAPVGNFSVEVSKLATSEALASGSYNAVTDVVGTGTLTIKTGTTVYDAGTDTYTSFTLNPKGKTLSIVVDSTNNTLEGIRDAINDVNLGVSAVIVNDGAGYRLLLNSVQTGAENSLEVSITNDGDTNDTDNAGLSALSFNQAATNLTQTVAAQDAQLKVNGLTVSATSNTVTSVIDGVTLVLNKVTTAPVAMNVSRDTASVKTAIEAFVNGYRAYSAISNQLSAYDDVTKTGNILIGDATLRTASTRIRQILNSPVENLSGVFSTLSEVGITTDVNGSLVIDDAKLDQMIKDNFDAIAGLFSAFGQIDDDSIDFSAAGPNAKPGEYDINIIQLATKGEIVGTGVLPDFGAGSLLIDATNDSLVLKIDGIQGSAISITQGSYATGASIAQEIETRLNGVSEFVSAGITVTVSYDSSGNALTISSKQYGSASTVEVTGIDPTTTASLGFTIANGTAGVDVAGSIGGVAATGVGQSLTGADGSDSEGLVLSITGGALGARAPVKFSRGVGDQLDTLVTDMLATDGLLDARTSGIDASLLELKDDLEVHLRRMSAVEARLRSQFGAMDALISQLQSTGSFLTSALASLPGPSTS
jgi:flagellar hook-associated protein 2